MSLRRAKARPGCGTDRMLKARRTTRAPLAQPGKKLNVRRSLKEDMAESVVVRREGRAKRGRRADDSGELGESEPSLSACGEPRPPPEFRQRGPAVGIRTVAGAASTGVPALNRQTRNNDRDDSPRPARQSS